MIPEVGELDELETVAALEKNKIWLWTAVDHFKAGILGWVIGDHSAIPSFSNARSIDGLTTKVQGDCLNKMVDFGILERIAYAEVPPRVEDKLTHFGQRFVSILDAIAEL